MASTNIWEYLDIDAMTSCFLPGYRLEYGTTTSFTHKIGEGPMMGCGDKPREGTKRPNNICHVTLCAIEWNATEITLLRTGQFVFCMNKISLHNR